MGSTKQITFEGREYTVPSFVSWIAQDSDGTVRGFQYEPFQDRWGDNYYSTYGRDCVLFSPQKPVVLRRV